MCQPQRQNLANVVCALLHRESGTPCHSISVLIPSAENSSGLGSKPTSLSAPTHDSAPRTIEECSYLLTYLRFLRVLVQAQPGYPRQRASKWLSETDLFVSSAEWITVSASAVSTSRDDCWGIIAIFGFPSAPSMKSTFLFPKQEDTVHTLQTKRHVRVAGGSEKGHHISQPKRHSSSSCMCVTNHNRSARSEWVVS